MPVRRVINYLRDSLWFVPTLLVLAAAVLAFAMIQVDRLTPEIATRYPLIFGGGADGARGLLSSIASSMITVAGVTFSITIVALQLASSQFSPRVLRNFMRDRASQLVLGSFIGTFTYAILVLRSIRAEDESGPAFVPALAVSVGIGLGLVALGMLVFFIHHISTRIQISTIVAAIGGETERTIKRVWRDRAEGEDDHPEPDGAPGYIRARSSGYLQYLDVTTLVRAAIDLDVVVRLEVQPGRWVQEHVPLFAVWPAAASGSDDLANRLIAGVSVGNQRSLEQDAAFGIRQLVDIGVKALSPGINDPTTATDCINRLTQLLVATGRRLPPVRQHVDDAGHLRVVVPHPPWEQLVALAFDQIRAYGGGKTDIALAVADGLATIAVAVPGSHAALREQAHLLMQAADAVEPVGDRSRVVARLVELTAQLA
jgi:uncharacterized membrane protein